MPCRVDDYPSSNSGSNNNNVQINAKMKKDLDKVTRILCSVMRKLDATDNIDVVRDVPELIEWWGEHQEMDKRRVSKEIQNELEGLSLKQLEQISEIIKKRK